MTDLNQFSGEKRTSASDFYSPDYEQLQGQFMPLSLSQQDICLDQLRQPDNPKYNSCLLYTSDAADDLLCVDLGGRRIIKKKKI